MNEDLRYCRQALPDVSRTFALGIELLRDPLRDEVGVAYLICRILDTIEDTTDLPANDRADLLRRCATDIADPDRWPERAAEIERMFSDPALDGPDHALCREASRVLRVFHGFRPGARTAIAPSVAEMADGMAATVLRERDGEVLQLESLADLERYCYYVAGTVGHLLTNLFALDRAAIDDAVADRLRDREVAFGLGLQVTNIVKNVTEDIERGMAYLPRSLFERTGIELATLIERPDDPRGREVVGGLIEHALGWLDEALEYTLTLPTSERDLRLFCGLPLAFAVRTLGLAARGDGVFSERALKISRTEVRAIHGRLRAALDDESAIRRLYDEERERVASRLAKARS